MQMKFEPLIYTTSTTPVTPTMSATPKSKKGSRKYSEWERGEPAAIQAHTQTKHQILQGYLSDYIHIVGGHRYVKDRLNLTLVDGFAGGQSFLFSEDDEGRNAEKLLLDK